MSISHLVEKAARHPFSLSQLLLVATNILLGRIVARGSSNEKLLPMLRIMPVLPPPPLDVCSHGSSCSWTHSDAFTLCSSYCCAHGPSHTSLPLDFLHCARLPSFFTNAFVAFVPSAFSLCSYVVLCCRTANRQKVVYCAIKYTFLTRNIYVSLD
jgi:hypothetical protein